MRKLLFIVVAASAVLAACQPIPAAVEQASTLATENDAVVEYTAHGTEPFWGLSVKNNFLTLRTPDDTYVREADFETRSSTDGWSYASSKMSVEINRNKCSDGMSDWIYNDTVKVKMGDLELNGCGGGVAPPESLEGSTWRIDSINNDGSSNDISNEVTFRDGRMSGSVGCNRLSADYKFVQSALSFGPIMSTKMACPDPVGKQEFIFVTLLGNLASTKFPGDGSMVLNGRDGSKIVLMQSI
jgi:heat shock protein HslJ